jgi:dienelactone hydrolase
MRIVLVPAMLVAGAALAIAQSDAPKFDELATHFNYSSRMALDFNEASVEQKGNALLIDLTYVGQGDDDHVPAYLVMPRGGGPYPAIIWGHWLKKGSRLANRDEFLEEALALARSGVVSLLIDAPQALPTFVLEKEPLDAIRQESDMTLRQAIAVRRGVDLLLTRRNVDRTRIAFVGHSWDAHVGAILAAVEKRIDTFVLMAGTYSDQESTFASKDPQVQARIKEIGQDKLRDYFHDYAWDDPIHFIGHTEGKAVFLQFGEQDAIARDQAKKYFDAFSAKDKKMEFYPAGHALNNAALIDRDHWLEQHLRFKHLDEQALRQIPQLK